MGCCKNVLGSERLNWVGESLRWFANERTPLEKKICVVAGLTFALIAAFFYMAVTLGPASVIGTVLLANVVILSMVIGIETEREEDLIPLSTSTPTQFIFSFLRMYDFPYETVPEVQGSASDAWERHLKAEDLTSSIMKGVNKSGTPFVAMKVIDRHQDNQPVVLVVYLNEDEAHLFIPNIQNPGENEISSTDVHLQVNLILSQHGQWLGRFKLCR